MNTTVDTTKQAEYTSVYRMLPTACPSCGKRMTSEFYCKFLRAMIASDGDTDETFKIIGIRRMCCKIPFLAAVSVMMRSIPESTRGVSNDASEQHMYIRRKKNK